MMGFRKYVKNIWEAVYTIALGMKITARYGVDPREEITEQYPEDVWEPFERFRGFLHNDVPRCISCSMCARVCPVDCIELESFMGPDKKRVLTRFDIDIGRCMYCGLCVEVCPTKCLTHTAGYEGRSSVSRGELILNFVTEPPEMPPPKEEEKKEEEVKVAGEGPADEDKAKEADTQGEMVGASAGSAPISPKSDPPDKDGEGE
ncbi:MAG: 4Fe-4S dicluster domain-containing protein [Deltaproteobacteria bacterium]|nr:4Fe-4S dicluster domain-containing protein [Deltaproteobacteria bacterium]